MKEINKVVKALKLKNEDINNNIEIIKALIKELEVLKEEKEVQKQEIEHNINELEEK